MTYETILYEKNRGVLTITLNRPDKLNALNDTMRYELLDAFQQAQADPDIRTIVVTGAGRGFCSGADLVAGSEPMTSDSSLPFGDLLRATYNRIILQMRALPKPIIAAVNGVAAGAGMSLALACDLRIASDSASFTQAFIKIGLVPDSGSTWLLPRLVGVTRAMELMLTGRRLSAQEALDLGIVNQVVPADQLPNIVSQLTQEFANAPTRTIGYIKQAVDFALENTLADALEKEADLQELAGKTSDHLEGVAAFLQKRQPHFTGR